MKHSGVLIYQVQVSVIRDNINNILVSEVERAHPSPQFIIVMNLEATEFIGGL